MSHQCYYCDQIFDSKEKLYDHLEVHSDSKEKPETIKKKKLSNNWLIIFIQLSKNEPQSEVDLCIH